MVEDQQGTPPGATIYAGAGPIGTAFSPTRLTAYGAAHRHHPVGHRGQHGAVHPGQQRRQAPGWRWSPTKLTTTTLSPSVAEDAVISGNADLWTANAGYNQDIGIFVS